MYICLCNPFSDRDVQDFLRENPGCGASVSKVYKGCTNGEKPQCCSCLQTLKDMIGENSAAKSAA